MALRLEAFVDSIPAAVRCPPATRNVHCAQLEKRTMAFGRCFELLARRFTGGELGDANYGVDILNKQTAEAFEVKAYRHGSPLTISDNNFAAYQSLDGFDAWLVLYRHSVYDWRDSTVPVHAVFAKAAQSPLVALVVPLSVFADARHSSYSMPARHPLYKDTSRFSAGFVSDLLTDPLPTLEAAGVDAHEYERCFYRTTPVRVAGAYVRPHVLSVVQRRSDPLRSIIPF